MVTFLIVMTMSFSNGVWVVHFEKIHFMNFMKANYFYGALLMVLLLVTIGHVDKYHTMHYFGNPRQIQPIIAYIMLLT